MKICTQCNEEKELSCFSTWKNKGVDTPRATCKVCFNLKYNAKHYQENKPRYKVHANKQFAKQKEIILKAKESGCIRCGELKPWRLAFHHLGDKEAGVADIRSVEKLIKEIAKCVIVCHNCHADIHHELRNNPSSSNGRTSDSDSEYRGSNP